VMRGGLGQGLGAILGLADYRQPGLLEFRTDACPLCLAVVDDQHLERCCSGVDALRSHCSPRGPGGLADRFVRDCDVRYDLPRQVQMQLQVSGAGTKCRTVGVL
jgi:hypothetical protein